MTNRIITIVSLILAFVMLAVCFAGCGESGKKTDEATTSVKLNRDSGTKQVEVTVKQYVDGDTTHFNVPSSAGLGTDVLKARYLAVNTPESTGKIEE
jgi:hypothetical protein